MVKGPSAEGRTAVSAERVWLSYRRGPVPDDGWVLRDVSVAIRGSEITAFVGVNGCGKSTLLQVLSGLLAPQRGSVVLHGDAGRRLGSMPPRRVAREIAVMHQVLPPMPGVTVAQLVEQGRYPHRGPLGMLSRSRDPQVAEALAAVGMADMAARPVEELSGGERQRVRLALALAQQAPILMLDEPTAHLDIGHQLEMLELVATLRRRHGLTVVAVLHDLDHAARFADRVIALKQGSIVADGCPGDVITAGLLRDVFAVEGRVVTDDLTGRAHCLLDRAIRSAPSPAPAPGG